MHNRWNFTASPTPKFFKSAAECTRLAETTSDPDMKLYLMKLALSWMQAATEAEHKVPESCVRPFLE